MRRRVLPAGEHSPTVRHSVVVDGSQVASFNCEAGRKEDSIRKDCTGVPM